MAKVTLIVVENRDYIPLEYAKFLTKLAWTRDVYSVCFWHEERRKPVWKMREEMITVALGDKDCTHILSVDTDVIPPDEFLKTLV